MDEQVARILNGADTEGWKTIPVEFGDDMLVDSLYHIASFPRVFGFICIRFNLASELSGFLQHQHYYAHQSQVYPD